MSKIAFDRLSKEEKLKISKLRKEIGDLDTMISNLRKEMWCREEQVAKILCGFKEGDLISSPQIKDTVFVVVDIQPWLGTFRVWGRRITKAGRTSLKTQTVFSSYNPEKPERRWVKVGEAESWNPGESVVVSKQKG